MPQDVSILRRSGDDLGNQARARWRNLIGRVLRHLGENPYRVDVRSIDDVREGYSIYHSSWNAGRERKGSVRHPRHLIAFYVAETGDVIVARLFHERQMLARHLDNQRE